MKDFGRDFKGKYGHPDITVSMDDDLEFGAQAILNYFEDQICRGVVFEEGETVQIGWLIVMLKSGNNEKLEVWEPEFSTIPISWIRGANTTYRHLIVQKELCTQLEVEPEYPSLRQAALVSSEFTVQNDFSMIREAEDASNSGWVLTSGRNVNAGLEFRSLFEMAIKCRKIIPFLALPSGASVKFSGDEVVVGINGKVVSSTANDFVKKISQVY
ncbi:immunity protein Imm33 domain-containing protein [Burkholderia ubonensis]|uniref:Imm33-like domain-containing protein n=1 Tax=Burkholderia ubonensis subsp. mesacidophila TaxID=265293 RepID=A0A2A4FMW1_9BURK|nr:hypothetical protein [Burkholderia ubonensis]PCE34000.1 hypothetical protein BZL54_02305 [Burkholderia ubonensis subsp. mesacidophila]